MIICVKACTVYLLAFAVFLASASAGVDGMVLCICDGGIEIEKTCGEANTCCDETHTAANDLEHQPKHQCGDCTDLSLNGLDTLASAPRSVAKFTPYTLVASLSHPALQPDADAISAIPFLASLSVRAHGPDTRSTVFRI